MVHRLMNYSAQEDKHKDRANKDFTDTKEYFIYFLFYIM